MLLLILLRKEFLLSRYKNETAIFMKILISLFVGLVLLVFVEDGFKGLFSSWNIPVLILRCFVNRFTAFKSMKTWNKRNRNAYTFFVQDQWAEINKTRTTKMTKSLFGNISKVEILLLKSYGIRSSILNKKSYFSKLLLAGMR